MLSEFQKRKLTVLFHHHDRNNDGFLTKADYEGFAKRVCKLWDYAAGTPSMRPRTPRTWPSGTTCRM